MQTPNISANDTRTLLAPIYPGLFSDKVVVFGLRGFFDPPGENKRGIYDDAIGMVAPDQFIVVNGNTDPSVTRKGIAVLQDGVYKYAQGLHGLHHFNESSLEDQKLHHTLLTTGKDLPPIPGRILPYWALRQASPVTLLRDGNPNPETVRDPARWPMINIHRGGKNTTSSEGCQTIFPDFWQYFYWETVLPAMERWKTALVPYALLTKKAA